MAKKEKNGVVKKNIDKIGGLISKEIQKAAEQLHDIVGDFSKQAEELQKQIREPLKKFLTDIEDLRDRELKKIQGEYQRVIGELSSLQEVVSEKLGGAIPPLKKSASSAKKPQSAAAPSTPVKTTPAKSAAKAAPAKAAPAKVAPAKAALVKAPAKAVAKPKAAAAPKAASAPKPAAQPKAAAKPAPAKAPASAKQAAKPAASKQAAAPAKAAATKSAEKASTGKGDDLTKLTGVGPALAKKLNSAGITRYAQIANPSAADQKALDEIGRVKNSDKWAAEAKTLMA